ncbi:LysR family transcriptional regulator [Ornithinibacillus sp. L9]|uniref:LysR family transcriptional regulator n=1 Tax=Ornithinibacillus caprae TaxID=2678566 RepID=A0A6N8FM59_9BACI|nr:LysR family transcriptional regulator [Ornithinibacillus caprae]MUK90702.1 LysR family transcriptional regulator [Ornithinibacillus caprae]
MDIKALKTFIMAAEHENFRIVSEKMYVTQPAITFQIKQLEKELGEKLFVKKGRNVYLTEFGRVYYDEAKAIISQYNNSLEVVNRFKQGFHKTIRLAISPLLAETVLPTVIHKYIQANPHVELSITVKESIDIPHLLQSGEIDLGLSCMPGISNLTTIKFHEESISLICRHDGYDSESGPIIDAKEILEENILFTDNHPVYWDEIKKQLNESIPILRLMKVNQSYITKRFVLEGIGVSILPRSIIQRELMEGRLLEVPVDFIRMPQASMYLIYKHEHLVDHEFIDFISNFYYS